MQILVGVATVSSIPADLYLFGHGEEYPDGYFWEMIGSFFDENGMRRPREVKFARDGHYGMDSMEALIERINEEPGLWTVIGSPASFQIFPTRNLTRPTAS